MKAMIFAAGMGTRLQPLTNSKPKALVEVNGKTLLEHAIIKLIESNVSEIIINVHYLSKQIIDFLDQKNNFNIKISFSDESKELLDTGGGLKKASWFFTDSDPFIVYNVDIISNINLIDMILYHKQNNALATLAVRNRETSRYLLSNNNELCGWENTKTNEKIFSRNSESYLHYAFSGIHVISPDIFKYIKETGRFSIIKKYIELSKNQSIKLYDHNQDYWFDIGDIKKLEIAEKFLKEN